MALVLISQQNYCLKMFIDDSNDIFLMKNNSARYYKHIVFKVKNVEIINSVLYKNVMVFKNSCQSERVTL